MRAISLLGAAAAVALSGFPVQAALTNIQYDGTVTRVVNAANAFGFNVGDTVHYSVTFDPSKLMNVGATFFNIDAISGLPVPIPNLQTASLSDDPAYTATVTIGAYTFSKFDELGYGMDPFSAGRLPFVAFDGATFLGAVLDLASPNGFELDTDPLAQILHYFPTQGVSFNDFSTNGNFVGFRVDVDVAHAVFSAVPEPSAWALMILGFGTAGVALRRRRASVARSQSGGDLAAASVF